jgi:hypothetical protein
MVKQIFVLLLSLTLIAVFGSCSSTSEPAPNNSDIPSDPVDVDVPALDHDNLVPSATFTKTLGNESRIKVNLLGLVDPTTLVPIDLYADYNDGFYNFYLEIIPEAWTRRLILSPHVLLNSLIFWLKRDSMHSLVVLDIMVK